MNKYLLILSALIVISCSKKTTPEYIYNDADIEYEMLDTLSVIAPKYDPEKEAYPLPVYRSEATRTYDLVHTRLDLSFDWEKQHVLGEAYLTIQPIFYPVSEIVLDAKEFMIHEVSNKKSGASMAYQYKNNKLSIPLNQPLQKGEQIELYINYTAQPNEGPIGGSQAITSDKGLFFINPMNEIQGKPRQIWTQGETENNSKWFPTFDKPNERCTQEIYLTVADSLTTLSNGTLISSTSNGDGTKTDYWKQDQPHAPYLFMLAIGDFAVVREQWENIPLAYYVDPPYKEHAKAIFNHTPEMLSFFSEVLDYPYPWDKYSQVVAEDYVSGAMENTTGVIFGDFVQKTTRELIDNGNDQIVAHEMFHHWFGDLVTCESWSNLTLNEGFANYSEYLWYEHKYGKTAADAVRVNEMDGYLYMAAQNGTHPLIHYSYDDKEDMFDAHSYNKGGLVLHMLRNYIGDDAFFAALNHYLKAHAFTAVEADELRLSFESITGMDLNWFFNQWYFDEGHPQIEASSEIKDGELLYYTEQVQDPESHRPVFILPMEIALYDDQGNIEYHLDTIMGRKDTLRIPINDHFAASVLDGKNYLLAEIDDPKDSLQLAIIAKHSPNYLDRMLALRNVDDEVLKDLVPNLLSDEYYEFRKIGLKYADRAFLDRVTDMVANDPHSSVRADAVGRLADLKEESLLTTLTGVIENEEAYPPIITALEILSIENQSLALSYAEKLKDEQGSVLIPILVKLFVNTSDAKYIDYIRSSLDRVSLYQIFNLFAQYKKLVLKQDAKIMMDEVGYLIDMAMNHSSLYHRYLATTTIVSIKDVFKKKAETEDGNPEDQKNLEFLNQLILDIKANEKDASLVDRYQGF